MSNKNDFKNMQKYTIQAAIDLLYSKETITELKNAKTADELTRIMTTARKERTMNELGE